MSQTPITITDGVTTHADVLNIINSNSADAESRMASLEGATGEHLDFLGSGDNVSLLTNDAGYLTDAVQSGDNVSLLANDAGYLTDAVQSGDNVSLLINDAGYSLDSDQTPQLVSSSSSVLTLDASLGNNANTILTEDVTGFSITNTVSGDSGLIIVEQNASGSWTFTSAYDVLAGDLADIASITASGIGAASIGWYNDGTDNYLYVSNFT
jgi:hypothetical protein